MIFGDNVMAKTIEKLSNSATPLLSCSLCFLLIFIWPIIVNSTVHSQEWEETQEWEEILKVGVEGRACGIHHVEQSDLVLVRGISHTFVLSEDTLDLITSIPIGFSDILVSKESETVLCEKKDIISVANSTHTQTTYVVMEPKTGNLRGMIGPIMKDSYAAISPDGNRTLVLDSAGLIKEYSGAESKVVFEIELAEHTTPLRIIYSVCGDFAAVQWKKDLLSVPLNELKNLDYLFTVVDLRKQIGMSVLGAENLELKDEYNFSDIGFKDRELPSTGANDFDEALVQEIWVVDGIRYDKRMYTVEAEGTIRMWHKKRK